MHGPNRHRLSTLRFRSQVLTETSNRPAHTFRGVTVTEFREVAGISTRFRALDAVRLFRGPRLVAAAARKHNTGAGSSKIGTKENPFAAVNFARRL
ncbi:unnamed protein product, partial [Iphiclides podalirius]